jgi:3-deoxy-D-manno-octulosonic-acid transferase
MSLRSYKKWQERAMLMAFQILSSFELVFAQTEDDAQRFRALGAGNVRCVGNLKYDADALPCNETDLFTLQQQIGLRPLWFAASTHAGEEEQLAEAHKILSARHDDLLTIIAPRHPERGSEVAEKLGKYGNVSLRSRGDRIKESTSFYIADTLGELGLFYRLCEIIFMGGSLIEHGGQNPLEAARLRCCVITGPHTENFADMYAEMEKLSICLRAISAQELADKIHHLMQDSDELTRMQMLAKEWLRSKSGAATRILDALSPIFTTAATE